MSTVNCLFASILQNIFFCVQQKKEVRTGLDQLDGEWMMTELYFFGWTIPLKNHHLQTGSNLYSLITVVFMIYLFT